MDRMDAEHSRLTHNNRPPEFGRWIGRASDPELGESGSFSRGGRASRTSEVINTSEQVQRDFETPQDSPTPAAEGRLSTALTNRAQFNMMSSSRSLRAGSEALSVNTATSSREVGTSSPMSNLLPADDGMNPLRQKLHQIREMALSTEERAQQMHQLMLADYQRMKADQADKRDSVRSQVKMHIEERREDPARLSSSSSSSDPIQETFHLEPDDFALSYYPHEYDPAALGDPSGSDSEDGDTGIPLGCKHYMRNVKVQCVECQAWYVCHHCHDENVNSHRLVRKHIRNMLCMLCGHAQRADEYCRQCEEQTAAYYCGDCKLWDNDATRRIYHCPDCGICRHGEGLGKDYMHCMKCNVCVSIQHAQGHRCVERATESDCPICGEYMFSSSAEVVAMKCGHYIHRDCYNALMNSTYKCPICNRSAVRMELQWRKMDDCIISQPMPEQYRHTEAWILCNDCTMRSSTAYHWLGNKCRLCDSYNTTQIKLINEPNENAADLEAVEARQHQAAHAAGLPHPSDGPLTGHITRPEAPGTEQFTGFTLDLASPQHAVAQSVDLEGRMNHMLTEPEVVIDGHNIAPAVASSPPPLDLNQASSSPLRRNHSESSVSFSMSARSEMDDDTTFWGEGINPGDYMPSLPKMPNMPIMPTIPTMPSMPTMPAMPSIPQIPAMSIPSFPDSWRSPKLFARRDDEPGASAESAENARSWRLYPSGWRLSSPTGFWRTAAEPSNAALSDDELTLASETPGQKSPSATTRFGWDPRQWRFPGSPGFFRDEDAVTDDTLSVGGTSPDSGSHWPIDPRQWRLGSSPVFGRSRSVDTAILQSDTEPADQPSTSPSSFWDIHPREYLARRFGSFSFPGASEPDDDEDKSMESDEEEDEESEGESEEASEDDGTSKSSQADTHDRHEDREDDEMNLIGHR